MVRPVRFAGAPLLCVLLGCGPEPDVPRPAPRPAGTSTSRVHRGDFRESVLLTGTLEATRGVRITPPRTPTWQVQIRWIEEDGAYVEAGQKVLELDNTAFATDLEQKRLDARKEEKEIERQRATDEARAAELGFALEQRRVEVAKAEIEASVPRELQPLRDYQEKQLALERARTAEAKAEDELATHVAAAEQELAIRRATLETTLYDIRVAERAIAELSLEAPTAGVLLVGDVRRENRRLQVGDSVWPGYIVARIPDLREMQVEARLSDVDDGKVRPGWPAVVRLDSYPELTFEGVVKDITPVAQEASPRSLRRTFRVRVALEQTDSERMRPGMAARVDVLPPAREGVLLAPRSGLDLRSTPAAAVLSTGERREIVLGPCNAVECVVEDGLEEGAELRVGGAT